MPITRLQDVIQPEIFTPYTVQRTMELSELVQSGIAENTSEFDSLASGANTLINMPYWEDLSGDAEVMEDTGDTVPGKIQAKSDIAKKTAWTKSFGANALSAALAGSDPMRVIADRFAAYWVRHNQSQLLSVLDGVFASPSMANKIFDITGLAGNASILDGASFVDAGQIMGDAKDSLTGVMMHSIVEAHLVKNDLIEYRPDSEGVLRLKYFMGKRVVVDDAMAYDSITKSAVMYIFGQGAIAWGNGSPASIQQTELVREGMSLAGEDVIVNRRISLLHPRGIKWTELNVAKTFPSLVELEDAANWDKMYEDKAIRIVKFIFKLA
jgi:hypothetical protein